MIIEIAKRALTTAKTSLVNTQRFSHPYITKIFSKMFTAVMLQKQELTAVKQLLYCMELRTVYYSFLGCYQLNITMSSDFLTVCQNSNTAENNLT